MHRFAIDYLKQWKVKVTRKPLVIRGARQVGKSFLVRLFAQSEFSHLLEVNFERMPDVASLFHSKAPQTILKLLEARFNVPLEPGRTLLFLDEIQAAPEVFACLRYFYEDMPTLHVIAAGSLLEFVLEEHSFSMPVGRIEYLHLGPMQFEEFLLAMNREKLREWLCEYATAQSVPAEMHAELHRLTRQYVVVGGLPEAVAAFARTGSYQECEQVQQSIISTYRDDFSKYAQRVNHRRVEKMFERIPQLVGRKFMYSHVDPNERSRDLATVLKLLGLAHVAYPVRHTHANGIPLGAEADDRNFKVLFLDVGLLGRSCGLRMLDVTQAQDLMLINGGAVCEQFVGQHLVFGGRFYEEPTLYYWMRQKKSSNAEVDYVIAIGQHVIPVEVKAGKTGTLKSMHMFLMEKNRNVGLRFNGDFPSLLDTQTHLPMGSPRGFRLLSLPFYLVGQTVRLLREVCGETAG